MSSIEISSNARSPNSRRPTSSRCSRVVTPASLLNFVQEGTGPCVAACEKGDRPLIRRVRERGLAPDASEAQDRADPAVHVELACDHRLAVGLAARQVTDVGGLQARALAGRADNVLTGDRGRAGGGALGAAPAAPAAARAP